MNDALEQTQDIRRLRVVINSTALLAHLATKPIFMFLAATIDAVRSISR